MEHSKLVGLKGLGCGKMIVGRRLAMLDLWQSRASQQAFRVLRVMGPTGTNAMGLATVVMPLAF